MGRPTEEQIKEFWEWCGYIGKLESIQPVPNQEEGKLVYVNPTINLNDLFKYAVPFLLGEHTIIETYSFKQKSGLYYSETAIWDEGETEQKLRVLKGKLISKAFAQDFDLEKANTLALFWALWKVKELA